MSVETQSFDVSDRSNIRKFVKVPWEIYKNDPAWVPPLIAERMGFLSPKHPYFEHAQARFWIAYDNGRAVGRISAQFDQIKPSAGQSNIGYFGMFECIDDDNVASQLFECAETWLSGFGCELIRGPFSLSINQESGLLVDGFDTPAFIMMGHAKKYFQTLVAHSGYKKAKDLYAWFNRTDFVNPPAMKRIIDRYSDRVIVRKLDKNNVDHDLKIMREVFNNSWANNWGFLSFTEKEFDHLGREMLQLIPADLFQIAELDGKPAGMIVMLPNFNEITKDLNGRLFPLGIFKFLWRLKFSSPTTGRAALLGIKQEYQNLLMGSALVFMLIRKIQVMSLNAGLAKHEMSWVLEDNTRLNKILESLGGARYKTYRIFEKSLTAETG